jgi:1,4-dihydroxy-6-naphthoate synthase
LTTLRIGFSPCPNDTYIMGALANGKVDSPFSFEPVLGDVETLNQWALEGRLEVTKLSFTALGKVRDSYALLRSGGALGRGCGPLIVARPGSTLAELGQGLIASPGELTTAHLLLRLFLQGSPRIRHMVFSEIMPEVSRGACDFGLVIHEGRFSFQQYGLIALLDLGQWWEEVTGLPLPLGGIAVRRDLGPDVAQAVDRAIRSSIEAAQTKSPETMEYILQHAQEMDKAMVLQHIELYVNQFSMDIGDEGLHAVQALFEKAESAGIIPGCALPLMAY